MGHVLNSNEVQSLIRQAVVTITGYQERKEEVPPQMLTDGGGGAPEGGASDTSTLDLSSNAPPVQKTEEIPDNEDKFLGDELSEKKLFINITPIENIEQQVPGVKQEGEAHSAGQAESLLAIKQEKQKGPGASFIDIETHLRERNPTTSLTGKQLFMALKREVDAGRLVKQPHDGTYIIGFGIPLPKKTSPTKTNKMTVKDLLSHDGEKFAPGSGKKWTNKDGSPREKVKKPPKKVCQFVIRNALYIKMKKKLYLLALLTF